MEVEDCGKNNQHVYQGKELIFMLNFQFVFFKINQMCNNLEHA